MNYDWVYLLEEDGLRRVRLSENEWNLSDKDKNLICDQNYKFIYYLEDDGLRMVEISEDEFNLIDSKGNLIFKENYNHISYCNVNWNRYINDKEWNYKIYLKQKLIKNLLDRIN